MKKTRIGISQRVDLVKEFGERRDCLDQSWCKFLSKIDIYPVPIPNCLHNIEEWIKSANLSGFILTGGNDLSELPGATNTAPERDFTERTILDFTESQKLPVIGVCRGFQLMNLHSGGKMSAISEHVAVRHRVEAVVEDLLWKQYAEVNSFHNWGISNKELAADWVPVIRASDGSVEAAFHNSLNHIGIMWHPERENNFLDADLQLFMRIFK